MKLLLNQIITMINSFKKVSIIVSKLNSISSVTVGLLSFIVVTLLVFIAFNYDIEPQLTC